MAHGDDNGLLVPPRLAPIQAMVLCVRDEPEVAQAAEAIATELRAAGIRVDIDRRAGSFGRRVTDWELKGVPVRIEVGPRDLAEGLVTLARRDTGEKVQVPLFGVAAEVPRALEAIQAELFASSLTRRDEATVEVHTLSEAIEQGKVGFAKIPWSTLGVEGETALNAQTLSVRCLQRPDGSLPARSDEDDLIAVVARSY
jgi:prolyl-tRNA synthetase